MGYQEFFDAIQVGKEEYPPIPKLNLVYFFNKNKNDLRIE